MREGWEQAPLARVLRQHRNSVTVGSLESVDYAGVRLEGKGVYRRDAVPAAEVRASSLHQLRSGTIVYNRMWASRGAFGLVPDALDGTLVSNDFPAFELIDDHAADVSFLELMVTSPQFWAKASELSSGSTGRRRLKEQEFLGLPVALPPLVEQRRIVDLIGAVDDAIEKAEASVAAAGRAMCEFGSGLIARSVNEGWATGTLQDALLRDDAIRTGPFGSQLHQSDYVPDGPVAVIMPADMRDNRIDLDGAARVSAADAERLSRHSTEAGDILWSRRGDVTRFALVDRAAAGSLCGTGCFLLRPSDPTDSSWLEPILSSPATGKWLESNAVGATMLNLNRSILAGVPVPLPPSSQRPVIAGAWAAMRDAESKASAMSDSLRSLRSKMLSALLSGEHAIPDSYDEVMEVAA